MWVILTVVTGGGADNTYNVGYYEDAAGTTFVPELETNSASAHIYTSLDAAANRVNFLNGGDGYGRFQAKP
jgi:hypothetical protein